MTRNGNDFASPVSGPWCGGTPRWCAGRPPGSTNVTTTILKDALLIAATELGEITRHQVLDDDGKPTGEFEYTYDGKDGLVGYLRWAGINRPSSFLALLGRVLPTQLNIKAATSLKVTYKTVADANKALRERGITDVMVNEILKLEAPKKEK
jgi:hypothetical protein